MAGSNLGTLLLNIVTRSDTSGLNKTDNALRKTQNSIKSMSKDMGFLSKFAKGFLGYFSVREIGNALGSYLQLEKDIGAMKSRFFAVTGDEKQAAEEFEWIRKVATDTANDIKSTADSYSIFYSAVRKNMGEEATKEVFEDWTKVGRVLHLSEYQMERVTYALREMASKGAIYSQDLRMQIGTHVPNAMGLAQKAAEEMGIKGTDWFEKLQSKAKGSTKVTAEFVRRFSQQAKQMYGSDAAFKKAMQQPDALANEIKNIGTNFMINFSKAGGSYMTVKILQSIANALLKIDYNKLADSFGKIAHTVGDIASFISTNLPQIVNILRDIALYLALTKVGGAVGSFFTQGAGRMGLLALNRGTFGKWLGLKILRPVLPFIGNIAKEGFLKALLGFGTKFGLKGALAGIVNVIPVVGQILSAILAIWTIVDIIKLIMPKKDSSKDWLAHPFGKDSNLTAGQVYTIANQLQKDIQTGRIKNRTDWQNKVAGYGGGSVYQYLHYNDNGKVTIYNQGSGTNIDVDEWKRMTNQKQQKVTNAGLKAFNFSIGSGRDKTLERH